MPKKSTKRSKPPTKAPIDTEELAWEESPYEGNNEQNCFIGYRPDDPSKKLYPNHYFVKKDSIKKVKYFLLDEKDRQLVEGANEQNMNFLNSLMDFMKKFKYQKRIYLRMLHNRSTSYCLSDDLLEIIPLISKQQGTSIAMSDERIRILREKWAPQRADIVNTVIGREEIKEVMKMFNINLKSIEFVPDIEYDGRLKMQFEKMTEYACYINHDGYEVVFSEQAIYHLYRECMCGINWNIDSCKEHPNCKDTCKKMIKNFAYIYKTMDPNSQVSLNGVKGHIADIQNECFFKSQKTLRKKDYLLKNYDYNEKVPTEVLKDIYETFGMGNPETDLNELPGTMSSAFAMRIKFFGRWVASFFDEDEKSEKNFVLDNYCLIMNFGAFGSTESLKENILKKAAFAPNLVSADTEDIDFDDDDDKENYFDLSPLRKWRKKPEEEGEQQKANETEDDGWNDYSNIKEGFKILINDVITINEKIYISNHKIGGEKERLFFQNLTKFAKLHDDEVLLSLDSPLNIKTYSSSSDEFVVRSIRTTTGCYILTDEILELVPVLMEKQGVPVEKYEKRLKSYADKWKSDQRDVFNSVEVSFFKIIMNSFNVDRSLITFIPDPSHYKAINAVLETEILYTPLKDNDVIMSKEHGVLMLFQQVVCGVNWKTKKCWLEKNRTLIIDFKERYNRMVLLFTEQLRKGAFVTHDFVTICADNLLKHPIFTDKIVQRYSDFDYETPSYDSLVTMEEHAKKCERFGIPENYQIFKSREPPSVPMFILKTYNYVEMMEIFYPENVFEEKEMLLKEIVLFLPKDLRRKGMEYFRCIVRRSFNKCYSEQKEERKKNLELIYNEVIEAEATKKWIRKEPNRVIKKALEAEQKRSRISKPPVVEEVSDDSDPPPAAPEKPKKAKKIPKEPRPCQKCTENGVALLKARDDLKKIEIIAKSNEKRAKRTGKVEKDLEDKKLEMEKLERDIENLKMALKDFDKKEESVKIGNRNILKDIENLEQQIEVEAEKTAKDRRINSRLIEKFNQTQEELIIRESERETQGKGQARTSSVPSEGPSTFHVPFVPSLPTTDDPDLARNPDWVLEQWGKMKSNFEKDDVVQDEKEMIEKLLAVCNDLYVKNLAEYELFQFEATSRIYLQNIELNILKIQKTGDISNMRPLAKCPSLSAEFWVEYGKYMGC